MEKIDIEELSFLILLEIKCHLNSHIDYQQISESGDIETVMLPLGYAIQEKIKKILIKNLKND